MSTIPNIELHQIWSRGGHTSFFVWDMVTGEGALRGQRLACLESIDDPEERVVHRVDDLLRGHDGWACVGVEHRGERFMLGDTFFNGRAKIVGFCTDNDEGETTTLVIEFSDRSIAKMLSGSSDVTRQILRAPSTLASWRRGQVAATAKPMPARHRRPLTFRIVKAGDPFPAGARRGDPAAFAHLCPDLMPDEVTAVHHEAARRNITTTVGAMTDLIQEMFGKIHAPEFGVFSAKALVGIVEGVCRPGMSVRCINPLGGGIVRVIVDARVSDEEIDAARAVLDDAVPMDLRITIERSQLPALRALGAALWALACDRRDHGRPMLDAALRAGGRGLHERGFTRAIGAMSEYEGGALSYPGSAFHVAAVIDALRYFDLYLETWRKHGATWHRPSPAVYDAAEMVAMQRWTARRIDRIEESERWAKRALAAYRSEVSR